jgi:hypothetical protein
LPLRVPSGEIPFLPGVGVPNTLRATGGVAATRGVEETTPFFPDTIAWTGCCLLADGLLVDGFAGVAFFATGVLSGAAPLRFEPGVGLGFVVLAGILASAAQRSLCSP